MDVTSQPPPAASQNAENAVIWSGPAIRERLAGYAADRAARTPEELAEIARRLHDKPKLSLAAFMATFTAPDYLIDGIVQQGRLYSLTARTGHGKTTVALYFAVMVAIGRAIGNIEVKQGRVIVLAGENPDDFNGHCHAAMQFYGVKPTATAIEVMPGNFPMTADEAEWLKKQIDADDRPVSLIIGDSGAAYFDGDDDNQNVQAGASARNWRVLTSCKGHPAVVVLSHPVKNAGQDNLIPRGGGAFLAEVDGNLTLWSDQLGESTTLHWGGKLRGADFQPVTFGFVQVELAALLDHKGRPFMSTVATLQSTQETERKQDEAITHENVVLELLRRHPGISVANIAINAGWLGKTGAPQKSKVFGLIDALKVDKLVRKYRGKWVITDAGKKVLTREDCD